MRGIAVHHAEEHLLVAIVEADPEAEPVRERDLLLDRLGRVDRRRALVLDHVARHQVAAVARRIEQHVVGPPFDAAVEHRFQRLVIRILTLEGEVVAEDQAAPLRPAQQVQQVGQGGDILAVDLDQHEAARRFQVGLRVRGLDQGGFAHPARAPEHHVVRRKAAREAQRVLEQQRSLPVHPLQQPDLHP